MEEVKPKVNFAKNVGGLQGGGIGVFHTVKRLRMYLFYPQSCLRGIGQMIKYSPVTQAAWVRTQTCPNIFFNSEK